MIRVGASGFGYRDWEGPFYPVGLPEGDRLSYYAQEFDTVEINYSYYRVPTAATLAALSSKTPPGFLFAIKANRGMTHEREDSAAVTARFCEALHPWVEQGCLGCVLAQFPSRFQCTPQNVDALRALRDQLGDLPTVIEFRHVTWVSGRIFGLLRDLGLGICCVDQPRLPTLLPAFAVATSDIAYVRLHGRNAAKWWDHTEAWERYDYRYSREELEPWAAKVQELAANARLTLVYANNHWLGQAIDTARQLKLLLAPGGLQA
jgi:uncharacterized protein YecE (DUF72 family)